MPLTDEQWESIKHSIWGAESSNGRYSEYNPDSGAGGAYQFMPETWREKANLYGFSEWAGVPNASYAPPYVQDSVARGWANHLYDKYNGDIRYVLNAWLSGESASDEDYAKGVISTTRSDGDITASEYVDRGLGSSYISTLDTSLITTNTTDQSITNTDNLRPETIQGANLLGAYMMSNFHVPLMITGGAEVGYHTKSSTGHGHEDGWKLDVADSNIAGGTQAGAEFKAFCNNQGWSCNWEDDHWDIDFSGQDSRDPQRGFSGDIFSKIVGSYGDEETNYMYTGQHDMQTRDYHANDWQEPMNWLDALLEGGAYGVTTTGFADVAQSLWGNLFHSSNHFGAMDKVTQEDIDYVKNALPGDVEAQKFALYNGRDSEEIRWFVNQKLVDKKRLAKIAQYNAGCTMTWANVGIALGGMIDPLMFMPVGTAINGMKIVNRLGSAIHDVSKVSRIATKATRMGIIGTQVGVANAVQETANNLLKEGFGGNVKTAKEYGWDAVQAFAGGFVLGGLGAGIFNKPKSIQDIERVADNTETKAIQSSADLRDIHSETINDALKLHDTNFGKTIKSKYYNKLEENKRIVAMKFDDAKKLVASKTGIDIPANAKAFYVPNEDYTILITDKINPKEIDSILTHEYSVHAGLPKILGDEKYQKLMDEVSRLANKDGHVFNEARRKADDYNPEEILAYAVENDMLPKGFVSKIKGYINSGLRNEGIANRITSEQMQNVLKQQVDAKREATRGIHYNTDGSTAFAGIRYSKDNLLNPQMFANFYMLEQPITKQTQKDLPKVLQKVGKWLENTLFTETAYGLGGNSASNSIRGIIDRLVDDARGRGLGHVDAISAETNKQRVMQLLYKPYVEYANIRQNWCLKNVKSPRAFDKLVITAYNAKYAGNKANIATDYPQEVQDAVESIKKLRELQISLGKRSASDVGSKSEALIEKDWEAVDHELWRNVDNDMRQQFLSSFKSAEDAHDFLVNYYRSFAKKDIIKAKIERDIAKQNKKIQEYNDSIPKESKRKPQELLNTKVTDKDIEAWLDKHVDNAVDFVIKRNFDIDAKENITTGNLGTLNFFKERIPIDTTGVLKMPNGLEFSFDNNLRNYDLDSTIQKNINRFAGELSIKNIFGSNKNLEDFLNRAKGELQIAYENGIINKGRASREFKVLEDTINELRGMRPNIDAVERAGAVAHILRKLAYLKNGANMGFAQMGELGGTIAYGGGSQLFHLFKPLGKLVDDIRWGKITTDTINDVENQMFGETLERQIFSINYNDRVLREALTEKNSIVNKALIMTGDVVSNASKVTSAINMLPKMTDAMLRGMRTQTIMDSIKWANNKNVSMFRNPFSKAKLKASHISGSDANRIKEAIREHAKFKDGQLKEFDIQKWQQKDPISFAKWYGMIQTQAERAIISGSRIGNRNLFKDKNLLTQLMFQFKDYSLRSINAQTMRALSSRDLDDGLATMLSIVTNIGAYAVKAGATYQAMKATGLDDKAEEYWDRMFSDENLIRTAVFRSAILGSPISFVNDIGEAGRLPYFNNGSIRTTVNHNYGEAKNASDIFGNIVEQMPALQQANSIFDVANFAFSDEVNKRDFKKAMQALPIPQWFPVSAIISRIAEDSSYPKK